MINNIQFLRFIAAAMVIMAHIPLNIYGFTPKLINLGGVGVDIFFVISGFIIPYVLFGKSDAQLSDQSIKLTGADFFAKRIIRIWPLYFVTTIVVIAIAAVLNYSNYYPNHEVTNVYGQQKLDFGLTVESLTFTTNIAPIVNVGWTLQLEFVFYTTLAVIIALGAKKIEHLTIAYGLVMLTSMIFLSSAAADLARYFPPIKLMGYPMMMEFLFGLVAYSCYKSKFFLNRWVASAVLALTIPTFYYLELNDLTVSVGGAYNRAVVWGFLSFLLVWSAISLEPHFSMPKVFNKLGDASYSLYLIHWLALPWLALMLKKFELYPVIGPVGLIIVGFVVCQGAALLMHDYIEKPLGNVTNRLYRSWKSR